jgi:hypothetical protein
MMSGSQAAMSFTKSHSPSSHTVDDLGAGLAHLGLAGAHPSWREAPVHELAAPEVLRIVHVDHHLERVGVGPDPPPLQKVSGSFEIAFRSS